MDEGGYRSLPRDVEEGTKMSAESVRKRETGRAKNIDGAVVELPLHCTLAYTHTYLLRHTHSIRNGWQKDMIY